MKKLQLNKKTITSLKKSSMKSVKGGGNQDTSGGGGCYIYTVEGPCFTRKCEYPIDWFSVFIIGNQYFFLMKCKR